MSLIRVSMRETESEAQFCPSPWRRPTGPYYQHAYPYDCPHAAGSGAASERTWSLIRILEEDSD